MRIAEIADARGNVKGRVRIDTFPATVGRAFDNDVIIDDPYVSPHHLRLVEGDGGTTVAEDLGSLNGARRQPADPGQTTLLLPSGGQLVIGRTTLRFYEPAHPVVDALSEQVHARSFAEQFLRRPAILSSVAAAIAILAYLGFSRSASRDTLADTLETMLGGCVALTMWAALWAIAGRITRAGARFASHLAWASAALVSLIVVSFPMTWAEFAIPSNAFVSLLTMPPLVALLIWAFTGHLVLASSLSRRAALRRVCVAAAGVVIAGVVIDLARPDSFSSELDHSKVLSPLPVSLLSRRSIPDFSREVRELKDEVDELVADVERRAPSMEVVDDSTH